MAGHTYRLIEVVGTSPDGVDAAIANGIERASRTVRNLDWFQVTEIRGHLAEGRPADLQVTMKIGFRLEDE